MFYNGAAEVQNDPGGLDHPPKFQTHPITAATAGALYEYDAHAADPDFDRLTYSLAVKPDGMVVDPDTGVVEWTPMPAEVGKQTVIVRVADGRGGTDVQSFTVDVSARNLPPAFTTRPGAVVTGASQPYRYAARANDPDEATPGAGLFSPSVKIPAIHPRFHIHATFETLDGYQKSFVPRFFLCLVPRAAVPYVSSVELVLLFSRPAVLGAQTKPRDHSS